MNGTGDTASLPVSRIQDYVKGRFQNDFTSLADCAHFIVVRARRCADRVRSGMEGVPRVVSASGQVANHARRDAVAPDSREIWGAGALLRRRRPPVTLLRVNRLTKQEQLVLCAVLGLLLVGLAVKVYRAGHAMPAPAETAQQ